MLVGAYPIMTIQEIEKSITKDFLHAIITKESQVTAKLTSGFREVIKTEFKNTPEYFSIVHGVLKRDFGLGDYVDGAASVESIVDAVEQSVFVAFWYDDNSATFEISAFKASFEDALSASGAKYASKGGEVTWLSWLLFGGADVINPGFGVLNNKIGGKPMPIAASRTGSTIMLPIIGNFKRPFKVADEFQGTSSNNWITRIAEAAAPILFNLISKEADAMIAAGAGAL